MHGVLYQVLTTDAKPLRTLAPSIPAALERVVAKAMNKAPQDRYETAGQMQNTLLGIRAALSGATDSTTQRLGLRWTPLPAPILKLVTHAPLKWRMAVLIALAVVVTLLVLSPSEPEPQDARARSDAGPVAAEIPAISVALGARRDSALAARDRAVQAGALKNNVPAMVLGEAMVQASEQALQAGDQSRALSGYVAVVAQYHKAQQEALALDQEARRMIDRVAPVVQAIPTGPDAVNAGIYYARAESLWRAKDFTLAKVSAQSAEQIGNIRVLYPRMTEQERSGWEAFFREWDQITAKFTVAQFTVRGATAAATVRALFEYIPGGGGAPHQDRRRFAMRFEKRDVGWRLTSVSELK